MEKVSTKLMFAQSIKELMKTKTLDRITVTEIVENCGTTRQTFYRNFKDKYDVVNWYFQNVSVSQFEHYAKKGDFKTGLTKKYEIIADEYHFYREACNSYDINSLANYDFQNMYFTCINLIEKKLNAPASGEIKVLTCIYCHGCIDLSVDWVRKGMPFTPTQMGEYLWKAMPAQLKTYLS